jgi:Serine protease inhibitor
MAMPVTDSYTAISTQQLGFALLRSVFSAEKSVCISPINISLSLQAALFGARGNTAIEMLRALGINAPNRETLAGDAQKLIQLLQQTPKHPTIEGPAGILKLVMVNSIWTQLCMQLNPEFSSAMQASYLASCGSVNFGDPRSVDLINSWFAQATENRTQAITSELPPNNAAVLISCAYFKARWNHVFRLTATDYKPFYLNDNSTINTPTMYLICTKRHFQDERVQILQMHYTDKRFGMYIVLPARGVGLQALVSTLSPELWQWWLAQLKAHSGTLSLPKFKIESTFILNDYLKHLGVIEAFSPQADFSSMLAVTQPPFNLEAVIHNTFIDVDELGTEAETTEAIYSAAGPRHIAPFEMIVDRPFLYVIYDTDTKTILFMGTVNDPRKSQ